MFSHFRVSRAVRFIVLQTRGRVILSHVPRSGKALVCLAHLAPVPCPGPSSSLAPVRTAASVHPTCHVRCPVPKQDACHWVLRMHSEHPSKHRRIAEHSLLAFAAALC
jgi:hypothetical protein